MSKYYKEEDLERALIGFVRETGEDRSYHTYRSDTEYSVDASDMEEFTDFFRENFPDYVGIECMVGSDGIWFWDSSLERAESY